MALSNIRKEPQREITESLLGIVALAGVLWLDYLGSLWFYTYTGGDKYRGCPWEIGIFILPLTLALLFFLGMGILYGTHALGEILCEALAARGLELRPKRK
jgi:hypothetical protein